MKTLDIFRAGCINIVNIYRSKWVKTVYSLFQNKINIVNNIRSECVNIVNDQF